MGHADRTGSGIGWSNPPKNSGEKHGSDQSNIIISSYDVCHFANAEQSLLLYDADQVPAAPRGPRRACR